jgi:xanthine phosphoribosyltransferase
MEKLKERIRSEGQVLPGNILKVDGFLNHRVDMILAKEIADEFARLFDLSGITAVLTVEASGIALGAMCASEWNVPLLFAKKAKSDNIEGGLYRSDIYSYTYRKDVTLLMSMQWLSSTDKVMIVDDFLANGEALRGLIDIVTQAGAELIGIGVAVEKGFQPGGKLIREAGHDLKSLAIVDSMSDTDITFREC